LQKLVVIGNALSGLTWLWRVSRQYPDVLKSRKIQVFGKPFVPTTYAPLVSDGVFQFLLSQGLDSVKLRKLKYTYWDGKQFISAKEGKEAYLKKFPSNADTSLRGSAVVKREGDFILADDSLFVALERFRSELKDCFNAEFIPRVLLSKADWEEITEDSDLIVWATAIRSLFEWLCDEDRWFKEILDEIDRALLPITVVGTEGLESECLSLFETEYDYIYDAREASRYYRFWPQYKAAEIRPETQSLSDKVLFKGDKNLFELWLKPFIWRDKRVIPFARGALIAQIVWRDLFEIDLGLYEGG